MSRLEYWKQRDLDEKEAKAIGDIEQYDCHVIQVAGGDGSPAFSHSLGLVETLNCPEIVVMGLKPSVAVSVINEIRDRVRSGLELRADLQLEGLLEGDYICELRQVRPQWYEWLFGWATWFHGSENYPVLQCVWPDMDHHFPWDEGFNPDWLYLQPILDRDDEGEARMDRMIASMKRSEGKCTCPPREGKWLFEDDPHFRTLSQKHVVSGEYPVLLVTHDKEDGMWQMLDGSPDPQNPTIVCLHHLVDRDPSLAEIADLPLAARVERAVILGAL